ncbi:MAG: hypothetical protein ACI8TE_001529 [Francisella sp.]|jgi:hypothetical protein
MSHLLRHNLCIKNAKSSERIGLISSSGARRLRPVGINVKNEISAPNWFLNNSNDIRSSYFLEDVATEFDIQGLEIDWACVAWGADFYLKNNVWNYQNFSGSKWQDNKQKINQEYRKMHIEYFCLEQDRIWLYLFQMVAI